MNAQPGNLYAVLGVPANATQTEIDHAYRALLRRHHPDSRGPSDESQGLRSDAALQDVFAAYSVLGDPGRRVAYDREVTTVVRPVLPTPRPAPRASRPSGQPPLVAGPVRWHRSGGRGTA